MTPFRTRVDNRSDVFLRNRAEMLALVSRLRELEAAARDRSDSQAERFHRRKQLLPRERLGLLLDPGAPLLEIGNLAGYEPGDSKALAGASMLAVIGFVSGTRCVVIANDSGIDAGAISAAGVEKLIRAEEIALENRLPVLFLVESAGGNLLTYRVEVWARGGRMFYNQARLSAAGIPVITVLHGSATAGGAYFPGMSDIVIGVRGAGQAFLAGPPLLRAATGEVADAESLGGVSMHAATSGLVEYVAQDDADALRIARDVVARLRWKHDDDAASFDEPSCDPDEIAGIVPVDYRRPYDVREVMARVLDGSLMSDFKAAHGPQIVCVEGTVHGRSVAIIGNNGAIDNAAAAKATHFIQRCSQVGTPLVFFQNVTGYMVGTASEQGGMIKNGAKMIQAVSMASVARFTFLIGASFGAGNYGMCGQGYDPRLILSWPNARSGVMGAAQAAQTMRIVAEEKAARDGKPVDEAALSTMSGRIVAHYEPQEPAFATSGRLCDDGVIDPRDTRRVIGFLLATAADGLAARPRPTSFGVARV